MPCLHSSTHILKTGVPQGCVLSPLFYSLYTYDCIATHHSNTIVKFTDGTVVVGLISNNNETACLDEVEVLSSWCKDNSLDLNVSNTKERLVDFRREKQRFHHTPLGIYTTLIERVSSYRYFADGGSSG